MRNLNEELLRDSSVENLEELADEQDNLILTTGSAQAIEDYDDAKEELEDVFKEKNKVTREFIRDNARIELDESLFIESIGKEITNKDGHKLFYDEKNKQYVISNNVGSAVIATLNSDDEKKAKDIFYGSIHSGKFDSDKFDKLNESVDDKDKYIVRVYTPMSVGPASQFHTELEFEDCMFDNIEDAEELRKRLSKDAEWEATHGNRRYRVDKLSTRSLSESNNNCGRGKSKMRFNKITESVTESDISSAIYNHFGSSYMSDDFRNVVEGILGRIDDYTDEDDINGAIDDELIYDDDQWAVMKHYQRPSEADFDSAMEELYGDIYSIASELAESQDEEEEEFEEALTEAETKRGPKKGYERGVIGNYESKKDKLWASEDDLYLIVYDELSAGLKGKEVEEHRHFKKGYEGKRYEDVGPAGIGAEADYDIIVRADSPDKFGFANEVADYYDVEISEPQEDKRQTSRNKYWVGITTHRI